MAKGFVHVNGHTYGLAQPHDSNAAKDLASRMAATSGQQIVQVRVGEVVVDLTVRLDRLWASGVWSEPERPSPLSQIG